MAIRVALNHRTRYRYDRAVMLSPHVVRLRPAPHCRTPVTSYSLQVTPEDHFLNWQQDPQGNFLARYVFPQPAHELCFEVDLVAELTVINPFDFFLDEGAVGFPFLYDPSLREELAPFLRLDPPGARLEKLLKSIPRQAERTVDYLVDLNRRVHELVGYVIRLEPGVQSCEETLTRGTGSCRDSAWLLVQVLRHLGLAARFVSGYLIQLTPDVKPLDGPAGASTDFTDLHAWTEVYLPGAGWVGLDPTSGLFTGEGHLPLAATPDPGSAAPITGATDRCQVEFDFAMNVTRIHEDPRVTKPYRDDQWERINLLGNRVDAALEMNGVRLTMGGEPTFVSIDDMDGPEWNTTALGPHKRRLAGELFRRLAGHFATGPLLHFGQGKWYPGESLPRWALGCYWRRDGVPIWKNARLVAPDEPAGSAGSPEAQSFITALARRLSVGEEHALAGYEDVWYYLWKERRLPTNVDPLESRLSDPEERVRLARIFERGLGRVVGYVLPLRPAERGPARWESGPWFLRPEHLFLLPGDSPMGYRLPLDSIPWVAAHDQTANVERDPFQPRDPLPAPGRNGGPYHGGLSNGNVSAGRRAVAARARILMPQYATVGVDAEPGGLWNGDRGWNTLYQAATGRVPMPRVGESASQIVRTALCVEPREGVLHIFLPPVPYLEDYLDLVAAIEDTAEELDLPVRLEGYPPPHDYRLQHFKVTPDPGVIEVNMQPAHSWQELVHMTTTLYDEARQSRLGTEKFMLDGRHTGTGGGNHLVLGGPTPPDSPFLRRPDLLRSLLAYWNNRPSLSYLFSGMFVGPTSQAPRADEARHESVYELETACAQIPESGPVPPWLIDRVFRHLLVDVTGNTHRAEFCIDKLFSPDSSAGRLGLVEMRAFEMPPHARMSLVQQLLVRSLVARFWKVPYRESLVRWGTRLHDQFLLPHFVAQDFREVIDELREAGFALEQEWFAPHFEFRFPLIGQVSQRGVTIELRQAIEPWHVLGEESSAGGAVRFVDSSVERVQVKVRGLTDPRHLLSCNGRRVPLTPTGITGEYVAGVRFRAWQPASCLHPTIGVHSPLVFDLYDAWSGRSAGGCTWHVVHPGGRNFERFPVNSYEAESRRAARFWPHGHTGGPQPEPPLELLGDYPLTLDLRQPPRPATLARSALVR